MMNRTSREKFELREELKLIPKAMVAAAGVVFFAMQSLLLLYAFRRDPHAPPVVFQVLISTCASSFLAVVLLLIGYVNRDAKRRGMNYVLWTLLVIFVPNLIGYIIYFVVRDPIRSACPQCGATVNPAFNFCPSCKYNLHPACPQCHRGIEVGASFCPYCSAELTSTANQRL